MADRFPSLEEFGDGQTEPKTNGASNGGIEADSDFLTRERAALGDDADLFSSGNDQSATVQDGDDDLLGGGNDYSGAQGEGEEISQFESSFPEMDTRNEVSTTTIMGVVKSSYSHNEQQMGPGGTITGSNLPYQPSQPSTYSSYREPEEEPEPIRQWRTNRDTQITSRESHATSKKTDRVSKAQRDIDDFYETYNSKKDKTVSRTRKEAE
ncbi:MAG: hypothetical protein Q9222_007847, partial [Ikaeria aurantiellina]